MKRLYDGTQQHTQISKPDVRAREGEKERNTVNKRVWAMKMLCALAIVSHLAHDWGKTLKWLTV